MIEIQIQTDDDEGCTVDHGAATLVPRVGETLYGPTNAPGPWLVTDVTWTRPLHELDDFDASGKPQKVAVLVRLNEKYDFADEGDIRPDYGTGS